MLLLSAPWMFSAARRPAPSWPQIPRGAMVVFHDLLEDGLVRRRIFKEGRRLERDVLVQQEVIKRGGTN
jgi:hypothetical protein